ncbi:MAG: 2,3-bisphosphoglycerate-independent phosphoglycerate mutase [Candidatus Nomurabacteria bacterium]|nr:2,3-bisphosphoglycerate-independent phosphoglycerate mutase [Candidatus Nomurabacteria bacterium]
MDKLHYKGPVVLVVMDGVGLSDRVEGNAVKAARLDVLNGLMRKYPMAKLGASGKYVGIPDKDMGNSEVGHNAMGAGEIVAQSTKAVDEAIIGGRAFGEPVWQNAIKNVKEHNSTLHFMGIFSDGNVHSNISHLEAMMAQAQKEGVARIRVHILVDGRDVPPQSEPKYIRRFEEFVKSLGSPDYRIASGGGRMLMTADRYENDWGMVEKGWQTSVLGEGRQFANAEDAVMEYRRENPGLQDQYMPPFVIADGGEPIGTINDGDSVIYMDFRADRAIEISVAFTYEDFPYFDRGRRPEIYFAGMTEYNSDTHVPALTIVQSPEFQHPLPEYLASQGVKQYAISETVKFGHITYYFNGNSYDAPEGETDVDVPSDTEPFDTRPWMKSAEITDKLVEAILGGEYGFMRVNYPNGDMVGHFSEMEPTVIALEALDLAIGRVVEATRKMGGMVVITADHGNAEELLDADGVPKTAHTTNPVPCIFVDDTENAQKYELAEGDLGLANIASTVALLLGKEPLEAWLTPIIKIK